MSEKEEKMSIQPIKPTPQTTKSKIKAKAVSFGEEPKNYVEDFRKKEEEPFSEYVTIDGVRYRNDELPNWTARPYDYIGMSSSRIEFYPEDIEKMKSMTARECIEYKKKLMKEGRCIE